MSPRLLDLFLAAPATSVASERMFSVARDTGTATRNQSHVTRSSGYASFLRYNLPAINFNYWTILKY